MKSLLRWRRFNRPVLRVTLRGGNPRPREAEALSASDS